MSEDIKFYVGLDVHKESIAVAVADAGSREEPRFLGKVDHLTGKLKRMLSRLKAEPHEISIAYEAGGCGFGLQRWLSQQGYPCEVIAPSRIPRGTGDRIKTDRRDALLLARLHRAGELVSVHVPDPEDEAVRDLMRLRDDARRALQVARQQLKAFLLRHGLNHPSSSSWGPAFFRYLSTIEFRNELNHLTLTEYRLIVEQATERLKRLDQTILRAVESWRWMPLVRALQALRGVSVLIALNTVAELGDLRRFDHPSKLMSFLGLVPSEYSSGGHQYRGSITCAGNQRMRSLVVQAAWAYRFTPRVSPPIAARQEGLSAEVKTIAWRAQARLAHRYRTLKARGVHHNKICVAIARELTGFIWDIAQVASPTFEDKTASKA